MYVKLENDSTVLENNKEMAKKAHQRYILLTQKSSKLWDKYGERNINGNLVIKSSKISEAALKLQKKIDDACATELKYLLSGCVAWQGIV